MNRNMLPQKILVKADTDAAMEFAARMFRDRPRVVQTIDPKRKGSIQARTFAPDENEGLRRFLDEAQGILNVYFQVNPLKRPLNGAVKASKHDVAEVDYLQVDIDPAPRRNFDEDRARILKKLTSFTPHPNVIIDSGGGYQAFWRLDKPLKMLPREDGVEPWSEAEALSRHLALLLTADVCYNIDRIMRFAGTVNVPDDAKIAKGRTARLASVVYDDGGSYPLSAFPRPPSALVAAHVIKSQNVTALESSTTSAPTDAGQRFSIDDLQRISKERGKALPDYTAMLIIQGNDPDMPDRYASRSEASFKATIDLVRAGFADEEIAVVLTDPDFGISAHVRDQKRPYKYALRQAKNARAKSDQEFECAKDGTIKNRSRRNIEIALAKSGIELSHNSFQGRNFVSGLDERDGPLTDQIINRMWFMMQEDHAFLPNHDFFCRAVDDIAKAKPFHPVVGYIDSLNWDGIPRLDDWLVRYLGAESTPLNHAIGAIVLIAAIRRIRQPGCKLDEMLVLEGPQGAGKSTAISILAVMPEWFSDNSPLGLDGRETLERISGFWIIEISELTGFRKRDVEELKGTLSRQTDRARLPYARISVEVPRQCIFVGTTNSQAFLEDHTGNRRFWIVKVGAVDLDALLQDRDQLWAEAAQRESQGESIRLPPELFGPASDVQERYALGDAFADHIASVIGDIQGWISAVDVRAIIGKPTGQFNGVDEKRMGDAMRRLGFSRKRRRMDDRIPWGYQRGDLEERIRTRIDRDTHQIIVDHGNADEGPF
jgi:Virulence-associated protein E